MAWQKVASLDTLRDGEAISIEVDGEMVALFRLGEAVYATSGMCTHEFALLADGFVEPADATIECPLHQALFDIRTGKALSGPAAEDLAVYPVRIEGGDVLIDLEDPGRPATTLGAAAVAVPVPAPSPERATDTSSVGTCSPRNWRGLETMSVVATASTRRFRRPVSAGASTCPANAEVPAPESMTRAR